MNSRTASMDDIYGQLPGDVEESRVPLAYTANWNGNFFNDKLKTRWSYSLLSLAKGYNNHFYAIGNELDLGKFNMYLDFYLSDEELDNRGIISSLYRLQGDADCIKNARYESWVTKLNYRFQPKWNIFVKGMYENASVYKYADQIEKGNTGQLTGISVESNTIPPRKTYISSRRISVLSIHG
ncbi:MAG: porin [Butyricimonas faecalis]